MSLKVLIAGASIALLAACAQEAPTVSLEQAKQITAQLKGTAFTPPPRTIDDIAQILERERPSPAQLASLTQAADASIPTGDRARRIEALLRRANAAYELGRVPQARSDAEDALRLARQENADPHDILRLLRLIATLTGSIQELTRVSQEMIRNAGTTAAGRAFTPLTMMAYNLSTTGDLDGARRYIAEAEVLFDQARDWQGGVAMVEFGDIWQGQIYAGQAGIEMSQGRNEEAEALLRRSVASIERYLDADPSRRKTSAGLIPDIYRGGPLVDVLVRQGKLAEAEAVARQSLTNALRNWGRYNPGTAFILTSFARVVIEQGRLAEGERLAREAVKSYEAIGASADSWRAAEARSLLADALAAQSRWREALAVYAEMERGFSGDPDGRRRFVESRPTRALALLMTGADQAAAARFQALARKSEEDLGPSNYRTAELRALYGLSLVALGRTDDALAEFRAAAPVLMQRSRQVDRGFSGDVAVVRAQRKRLIFDGYLSALSGKSDAAARAESFRIADIARSGAVRSALAASGARAAARDPELAELARREQDALSQIAALYGALSNHLAARSDQRDPAVIARLRRQIDDLRGARAAIAEELERRFPAYAELVNPKPATVGQARAILNDGEALIATYVGADRTYVWAVPKSGPVAFAAAPLGRQRFAAAVADLRRAVQPKVRTLRDIPVFDVRLANRLYEALLAPVAAGWRDAKSLMVVADGPLGQLPFSVLVTRPVDLTADAPPLFSNYKPIPWLARSHAVTVLPSVASLAALRSLPAADPKRRPFLGFGDPYFSPEQAAEAARETPRQVTGLIRRGGFSVGGLPVTLRAAPDTDGLASADLARLPRLPDTRGEVTSIARLLDADLTRDVFVGERATEDAVKSLDLSGYRILAFATHGLVPGDLDGLRQPALALSTPKLGNLTEDGLLTMGEVVGLRLDADWVVLSACNTAAGDGAGAEAFSGLGRAFFYAGTRALLLSNWPVETTSARTLTTDLFRRQRENPALTRAEALHDAMVAMIGDGKFVDEATGRTLFSYAHPIFWAPFTLVGDGGGGSSAGR